MKKNVLWALMLAVGLISCNNENEAPEVGGAKGESALLKVNIKEAGSISRAGNVDTYKAGSEAENKVSKVDFYFFNANGSAYSVDGTANGVNYITVTSPNFTDQAAGSNVNVESVSDVILVIKGATQQLPTQMVAIINDPNNAATKSLGTLETEVKTALQNSTKDFVMSNSVYMNGTVKITATQILPENIFVDPNYEGEAGAKYTGTVNVNPVDIYVERLAAKVEVKTEDNGLYNTGATYNGAPVYAQVLGWGVTNNTKECNLIKSINPAWVTTVPFTGWNKAENFRSYWATTTAAPAHNLTFNDLKDHNGEADYYFENTKPSADANSVVAGEGNQTPQLLVAAQLVDKDGKAITLGEWYGVQYTIEDLKTVMINTVTSKLFKKLVTTEGEGETQTTKTTYISIDKNDVVFEQMPSTTADNRYEVVVKTKSGVDYYNAAGTKLSDEDAQDILDGISPAKMWTEGYTYYYTDIKHYGSTTGIVRNHWYEINLKTITGLGTPVYNPELVIIPEIPEEDDAAYLAAQINILSWALVSQDVNLGN